MQRKPSIKQLVDELAGYIHMYELQPGTSHLGPPPPFLSLPSFITSSEVV